MGNVAEIVSGSGFPKEFQGSPTGDFPFAKVSNISHAVRNFGELLRDAVNYVDEGQLRSLRARPVPGDSIVFAKIGEALRLNRRAITGCSLILDNNCMALIPWAGNDPAAISLLVHAYGRSLTLCGGHCGPIGSARGCSGSQNLASTNRMGLLHLSTPPSPGSTASPRRRPAPASSSTTSIKPCSARRSGANACRRTRTTSPRACCWSGSGRSGRHPPSPACGRRWPGGAGSDEGTRGGVPPVIRRRLTPSPSPARGRRNKAVDVSGRALVPDVDRVIRASE